jgi:hypothetical protein
VGTFSQDLVDRLGRISGPASASELGADDIGALDEALAGLGYLPGGMSNDATEVAAATARLKSDYGLGSDDTIDPALVVHLITLVSTAQAQEATAEATPIAAPHGGAPDTIDDTFDVGEVASAQKSDDELAVAIIEQEYEILDQWDKAVEIFQTVMTSDADSETKPDFVKAAKEHFEELVLGKLAEQAPHGGEALELLNALADEVARARAASESAQLRDFFVEHKQAVAELQKRLTGLKDDFRAKVRLTEQAMWSGDQAKQDEYALMRMYLVEYFEDTERRLKAANTDDFFRVLSEEWMQAATVSDEYGTDAYIVIHLEEDFSIRSAEMKGTGADKLAEQLLRDSPGGVDVFAMKVPRRVLCYRQGESYPYAMVKLDENNNLTNDGSFAEGNYMPIYEWLMQHGLPTTTNINQ